MSVARDRCVKIVSTAGLATRGTRLAAAGPGIARLGFGRGTQHGQAHRDLRAVVQMPDRSIGVLADLQRLIVAGSPSGTPGKANALRVHQVGTRHG